MPRTRTGKKEKKKIAGKVNQKKGQEKKKVKKDGIGAPFSSQFLPLSLNRGNQLEKSPEIRGRPKSWFKRDVLKSNPSPALYRSSHDLLGVSEGDLSKARERRFEHLGPVLRGRPRLPYHKGEKGTPKGQVENPRKTRLRGMSTSLSGTLAVDAVDLAA